MRPYAIKNAFAVLLLLTGMVMFAAGCASDGTSAQVQASYSGYYDGYYGGYGAPYPYYGGNVVVGAPRPPAGVPPQPPAAKPPAAPPPHVSQLPARPLPAPAPRPMPMRR